MPLLSVTELRALVETDRTDAELTAIIAREEAAMVRKLGPHGDGVSTVTGVATGYGGDLFLGRPVVSVTSVAGTAWASLGGLALYPGQGRVTGGRYTGAVAVVYTPADDREERKAALIDLVRLTLARTAYKSESTAGEHSYSAPDWEAERAAIYRRLMFTSL